MDPKSAFDWLIYVVLALVGVVFHLLRNDIASHRTALREAFAQITAHGERIAAVETACKIMGCLK